MVNTYSTYSKQAPEGPYLYSTERSEVVEYVLAFFCRAAANKFREYYIYTKFSRYDICQHL